ncbi:citrate lyase subunit beta / citryl-CoA lyase [Cryobacterium flavum]|uniref:Citrate lyase subunit beta / citryl-CoA lyase n=1 Tax=Cryobacterium flavum TaxID=1424659 RepID=A0A5E9G3N9_9MICO|nr:CoA ester lyase [Cryobacterium flavum]SDO32762.1 citrate lyase subunit beta / citryl-CoA lyase [Cryobacterium flavum]
MAEAEVVGEAITALFVPGDRPQRFSKAAAARPDVVIVDWEDAVAPQSKAAATASTMEFLSDGFVALVRTNPIGSPTFESELEALAELATTPGNGLLGIMLPKADSAQDVERICRRLPANLAVVPLIESAAGLVAAMKLAAIPGVTRLAFGAIDFALDIGADDGDQYLAYARSELVVVSRAANIAAPLDSPTPEFDDVEFVASAARYARGFGFSGKLCIHPRQVSIVAAAFLPDDVTVAWARKVAGAADGVSTVDGTMVDRPVIERARRVLRRIGEAV